MDNSFEQLLKETSDVKDKIIELEGFRKSKSIKKDKEENLLIGIQIQAMRTLHYVLYERTCIALNRKDYSPNSRLSKSSGS